MNDRGKSWRPLWTIERFASEEDWLEKKQYRHEEAIRLFGREQKTHIKNNLLLNAGITVLLNLLGGIGGTAFSNAAAYMGVGDSSTTAIATQTNLQAATNKKYNAMAASYPQVSGQTITFQAAFASGDANYAWNEFIIANGSSGTTALNRVVSSQGTKTTGSVWTCSVAITIS